MRLLIAGALLLSLQGASGQVLSPVVRAHRQVKPYTMTQITTTNRTYANGMTSTETTQRVIMRDSVGRVRNEGELEGRPAMKIVMDNGSSRVMPGRKKYTYISVNDFVEGTGFTWSTDPDSAREVRLTHARDGVMAPREGRTAPKHEDSLVAEQRAEKLGTKAIQGVIAEGTRWTTKYPAGAFGASQEFTVVREEWVARDYGISVESSTDDPRTGKTETTLVSFSDQEPDAALFKPPAGYTVISDVKVEASAVAEQ